MRQKLNWKLSDFSKFPAWRHENLDIEAGGRPQQVKALLVTPKNLTVIPQNPARVLYSLPSLYLLAFMLISQCLCHYSLAAYIALAYAFVIINILAICNLSYLHVNFKIFPCLTKNDNRIHCWRLYEIVDCIW